MKTLIIAACCTFFASTAFTQPDNEKQDDESKTELNFGHTKVTIEKDSTGDEEPKETKYSHVGFISVDIGFNMLLHDNSFNLPDSLNFFETRPLNSADVSAHFLPTRISIVKGRLNVLTALTLNFSQYAFSNDVSLLPDTNRVVMTLNNDKYKKSKLNTWYLQVPLLLNVQTNPDNNKKNFHFSAGGYGGIFLGAKTELKSEDGDRVSEKDDFNLNRLRYGVTARIGFSSLDFYVNYGLSELFVENRGPAFTPITFGINVMGFGTND